MTSPCAVAGSRTEKMIALGADGVVIGTAELVAIDCVRCGNCERDRGCPIGIATTDPQLEPRPEPQPEGIPQTRQRLVKRFLKQYAGKSPEAILDLLISSVHPTPQRFATLYGALEPKHSLDAFTAFLRSR